MSGPARYRVNRDVKLEVIVHYSQAIQLRDKLQNVDNACLFSNSPYRAPQICQALVRSSKITRDSIAELSISLELRARNPF